MILKLSNNNQLIDIIVVMFVNNSAAEEKPDVNTNRGGDISQITE